MAKRAGVVVVLALFCACKKGPTAAQVQLDALADVAAHNLPVTDFTGGHKAVALVTGGEPEEGRFEVCAETYGELEWVRTAPLTDVANEDGTHRVEVSTNICMRPENGTCNRPNTYTLRAIMKEEEGSWVVLGSTCERTSMVR